MTAKTFGWIGRILQIDLTTSETSELDTMAYADRFLGGRGIATRIYWELVSPETGALDPENALILMSGPLTATGVPGASRFEVVSKSPMTNPEGFCYGNLFFSTLQIRILIGEDGHVFQHAIINPVIALHFIDDGTASTEIKAHVITACLFFDLVGQLPGAPFVNKCEKSVLLLNYVRCSLQYDRSLILGNVGIKNDKGFVPTHVASLWIIKPRAAPGARIMLVDLMDRLKIFLFSTK